MYRLIAIMLLAGCVATQGSGSYRNSGPIYSNAVLDVPQLGGAWHQVAAFGPAPGCAMGGLEMSPAPGGLTVSGRLCLDGRMQAVSGLLRASGPGRFTPEGPGFAGTREDWWILWADSGYRSLAIGTPSGRFGFALDRGTSLPPDRREAAREIFEWNGYRLDQARFAS